MRNRHVVGATIVYCLLGLAVGLAAMVGTPSAALADGGQGPEPPTGAPSPDSSYGAVDESVVDDATQQERVAQQSLTLVDVAKLAILTIL